MRRSATGGSGSYLEDGNGNAKPFSYQQYQQGHTTGVGAGVGERQPLLVRDRSLSPEIETQQRRRGNKVVDSPVDV